MYYPRILKLKMSEKASNFSPDPPSEYKEKRKKERKNTDSLQLRMPIVFMTNND